MIKKTIIKNLGPISEFECDNFARINLIIGNNRSGKTFLMKSLYASLKSIEQYQRGKNIKKLPELLSEKLYWTFQTEEIGELVRRPDNGNLNFYMEESNGDYLDFAFSSSAKSSIVKVFNTMKPRETNSIFIPAKEVLSIIGSIKREREQFQDFGFDDTYLDLVNALQPTRKGKNIKPFSKAREELASAIDGRIMYDREKKKWMFVQGRLSFDLYLSSEGTRKIGILDSLLGNHYLSKESVIFIDEPEAGLHPSALVKLLDIIFSLSKAGLQFFIASHSYFVIKKLYLIAHVNKMTIPVISMAGGACTISDLKDEMPDNPIVNESIALYEQEMEL